MDDYSPIASAIFRFAVAFLQADAGGERVRDVLERLVPPSSDDRLRVGFLAGRTDRAIAADAQLRAVVERFGRSLPDHLTACGVRPGLLREAGVEAVRSRGGGLYYLTVAEDDLGRGYVAKFPLPEALPVGFVIGSGSGGADAVGSAGAEPGAAADGGGM